MSVMEESGAYGPAVSWRTVEWLGAGLCLFLLSGAIFPLLLTGGGTTVDDASRPLLRLLPLPVYGISAVLLMRHPSQLLAAMRRNLPMLLLFALPFLSVLWSIGPSVTLRRGIGLLGTMLFSYVLATRFTPSQLLLLIVAVLAPCMVLSVLLMGAVPHLGMMDGSARGVFIHKNVLGWAAALSTVASGMMLLDRAHGLRLLGLLALPASIVCLLASKSMTGLLSTTAAAGLAWFYLALGRSRGTSRLVLIIVFLQFVALLLLALGEFLVPLLEALGKDATLTGRVPLWKLVDAMISQKLVLGYGFAAFWSDGNPDAWRIWAEIGWEAPHAHNGYREMLLGLGVVGLLTLATVLARALWQGAALYCARPYEGWLWLNVFIGMYLVMNLTEAIFLVPNDLFWTLFSAVILMISLRGPEGGLPDFNDG
ncbi:MAG: O-antigen ligase family protein [Amaricoccus sp.]|uniref:O-antigen ligase family protein n=1 Tax=Amaricoccus sp. TaxID=1872485 RepID=UPI0039E535A6